jgi:uncharacterized protein YigE (DUF2233 family)
VVKLRILVVTLAAVWNGLGCLMATRLPSTPTPIPVTATGWEVLAPGLERRVYQPPNSLFGMLQVLRIDPAYYTFRAHYRPGEPLRLQGWENELAGATAFINANFFTPEHTLLGLLVADGQAYGASLRNQGGTFQVQNGTARVRSNIAEPYTGETFEQAVQGFPMLVLDGQTVYRRAAQEPVSRRTVIAQDSQGRILFMATPLTGLSLADLGEYLPTTDMQIVNALNLDGGGSTLLFIQSPGSSAFRLTSLDPVPAVLAIYPR